LIWARWAKNLWLGGASIHVSKKRTRSNDIDRPEPFFLGGRVNIVLSRVFKP
jgi:hypothetical protein